MRAGPGGQHDDARAEEHGLGDAVGDEHDRLLRLLPDAQQLKVHLLARQRIERAERLVHQDQLRIVDQRARDRGALLHAAGELVRVFVLRALQPDQREQVARTLAALRQRQAEDLGRQQHVVDHAAPFQQQRLLEHHADVARRDRTAAPPIRCAPRRRHAGAGRRGSSAAWSCRSRRGRPARPARLPRRRRSPARPRETPRRACGRPS